MVDKVQAQAFSRLEKLYPELLSLVDSRRSPLTVRPIDTLRDYTILSEPGPYASVWEGDGNFVFLHPDMGMPNAPFLRMTGKGNLLIIGKGTNISSLMILCDGKRNILYIGDNYRIKSCTIFLSHCANIVAIGDNNHIQGAALFAQENDMTIRIGDGCLFSSQVSIMTSDGHSIFDRTTGERLNPPAPVAVDADVWLGRGARIAKGVTIGQGGVIGQGSLVTKPTEPQAVYAGVPARLIRRGIAWQKSTRPPYVAADLPNPFFDAPV